MERICPECGKPLPEGCSYQRVFHDECVRKRSRKKERLKRREKMNGENTVCELDYNMRVYKADEFWDRVSVASQNLKTSYGKLAHEAFVLGIGIEDLMDRLGV